MAILVTGAAGFVALNVVEHLLTAGHEVIGLDRIPLPRRAVRDFSKLPGRLTMIGGSILSTADLSRALTLRPVETVIHCAVITAGSAREKADAASILSVNVNGALATLETAARRGVRRFVYTSSGAVYGSAAMTDRVFEETTRPAPLNLYAQTKLAAESILTRIAEVQGVSFTAVRLGQVYGPWEYATGVRDTLSPMLQALEARDGAVLGQPWYGDYTFSRDIAAGLSTLANKPALPHTVYNLATGLRTNVEQWCQALESRLPGFQWRRGAEANVDSHSGFDRAAMDIGRITSDTGYRPAYDFHTAADELLKWRGAGP